MNYGLPYQGSKNRIAKRLVEALPAAPVLYDVFCGGCAVTHAAMLSGRYQRFVVNDLRGWLPDAFREAITGGYAHEDRWISREDFKRLKSTDAYAALCFSFGNGCQTYMYARGLEPYKRALHRAIFWRDFAPWAALCPETADALAAGLAPIEDRKQRRIRAGHFIIESLKAQLTAGTLTPDILQKPIYRQIRRVKATSNSLQSLERLERLERLESLERPQSLESLESLPGALTAHSGDYRELCFDEPGIIYCDPPYKSTEGYGREFDFDGFYSWCEHQANPVFISEYTMPEDRFVPVASFTVTRKMDARKSNICPEKIWRPRTQL